LLKRRSEPARSEVEWDRETLITFLPCNAGR
jgi:hypothetical protein